MEPPIEPLDLGVAYACFRGRLGDLLLDRDADTWSRPVPACPGWDVKAAVSHLVANVEDAMSGALTGPPTDEQVAAQIARHATSSPDELFERWDEVAAVFEPVIVARNIFPVVLDVLAHEHDIRGAIGEPGHRDEPFMGLAADRLAGFLAVPANVEFDFGDHVATSPPVDGPTHRVSTTPFEVFRLRLGRRSPEQVEEMGWDVAPGSWVDELFIFGPRDTPLVE